MSLTKRIVLMTRYSVSKLRLNVNTILVMHYLIKGMLLNRNHTPSFQGKNLFYYKGKEERVFLGKLTQWTS